MTRSWELYAFKRKRKTRLLQVLFLDLEKVAVIAYALFKAGVDLPLIFSPPQNKTLSAFFANNFHFYPHKKGTPSRNSGPSHSF
ncbi:hypothetical protein [Paenibacillus sp. DYY-L-2]|uniref:hypothetical protein n=1 Tax=Paenibacillus sp. DYY-L-2 TaxID=3447013 RepID=UPI003F4F4DD4